VIGQRKQLRQMIGEREGGGSCILGRILLLKKIAFNPLNAELNPTCHLLALLGAHHILHVSRLRFKVNKRL